MNMKDKIKNNTKIKYENKKINQFYFWTTCFFGFGEEPASANENIH